MRRRPNPPVRTGIVAAVGRLGGTAHGRRRTAEPVGVCRALERRSSSSNANVVHRRCCLPGARRRQSANIAARDDFRARQQRIGRRSLAPDDTEALASPLLKPGPRRGCCVKGAARGRGASVVGDRGVGGSGGSRRAGRWGPLSSFQVPAGAVWCLWSFRRLWVAVISRHSERAADLPRRWKRSIRRLNLVFANTGSIIALRFR
jgi:hypothetical protein